MCVVGEKNMSKILIVEDDEKLSKELKIFLDKNGYDSVILQKFDNAVEDILEENADLILLDINLPYTDGEYICKEIRKTSDVPIIMVTSRDNEIDELLSLNYGADQYVTKPFNIQILLAKITGLLKRNQNADKSQEKIKCNGFILNVSKSMIETENKKIELTKNELKILHYLVLNQALFRQIGIFFILPLILAIIHSIFGIQFALSMMSGLASTEQLLPSVVATVLIIGVIYGMYFLATYWGSKNIIKEEQ